MCCSHRPKSPSPAQDRPSTTTRLPRQKQSTNTVYDPWWDSPIFVTLDRFQAADKITHRLSSRCLSFSVAVPAFLVFRCIFPAAPQQRATSRCKVSEDRHFHLSPLPLFFVVDWRGISTPHTTFTYLHRMILVCWVSPILSITRFPETLAESSNENGASAHWIDRRVWCVATRNRTILSSDRSYDVDQLRSGWVQISGLTLPWIAAMAFSAAATEAASG